MFEPNPTSPKHASEKDVTLCVIDTSRFDEIGLPESLTAFIARRTYPVAFRKRHTRQLLVFVPLLIAIGGGVIIGQHWVLRVLKQQRTQGLDGVFHYYQSPGISALFGIFGTIALLGVVFDWVSRRQEAQRQEYDLFSGLAIAINVAGLNGLLTRWLYRRLFRNVALVQASEQAAEVARLMRALYIRPAQTLFALYGLFLIRDLRDYELATRERVLTHQYWSTKPKENNWAELSSVQAGCWVFDKGGVKLFYTVEFRDNTQLNLLEEPAANDVALVEFVESSLAAQRVIKQPEVFSHGIHSGKIKWTEECPNALAGKYPELADRIVRLVRIEQ